MSKDLIKVFMVRYLGGFLSFVVPLFFLVWRSAGLSDAEKISLLGYMSLSLALFEPVSGFITDGFGRKISFAIAGVVFAVALVVTQFANSYQEFFFAEVFLAFGYSLITGADVAILYETLEREGNVNRFPVVHSWLRITDLALGAGFSALGGILADRFGIHIPFIIGIVGILGMSMASMTLTETLPRQFSLKTLSVLSVKEVGRDLLSVVRRPGVAALFTLDALLMTFWIVADTLAKPLLQKVGTSNSLFGYYSSAGMALLALGLFIGGYTFGRISTRKIILGAILLGTGSMILSPLFSTTGAVIILLAIPIAKGIGWAINSMVISQKVPSRLRATSFSAVMVISRISVGVSIALLLRVVGQSSVSEFSIITIQNSFWIIGGMGLLLLGGILLFLSPYRKEQ